MCATCGCGSDQVRVSDAGDGQLRFRGDGHDHDHQHEHPHGQHHEHPHGQHHDHPRDDQLSHEDDSALRTHTIQLEQRVLAKNDRLAVLNRSWMRERSVVAVNLMSSPGSGKTTLLERTIRELDRPVAVIEGDQETLFDAERIRAAGARAVQVNTGAGCHLDATMTGRALEELRPQAGTLVIIENVGNLVCPAMFDLGESGKVVVISVTEGDDKPLKYPHMFAAADLVVVNKIDLMPYVDFDLDRFVRDVRRLNPGVDVTPTSAKTGENIDQWYAWLDAVSPPARDMSRATQMVDFRGGGD